MGCRQAVSCSTSIAGACVAGTAQPARPWRHGIRGFVHPGFRSPVGDAAYIKGPGRQAAGRRRTLASRISGTGSLFPRTRGGMTAVSPASPDPGPISARHTQAVAPGPPHGAPGPAGNSKVLRAKVTRNVGQSPVS